MGLEERLHRTLSEEIPIGYLMRSSLYGHTIESANNVLVYAYPRTGLVSNG